ncbi:amidohydrolase family protein [Arcobacter sp. CECT 9188]|uniref:amidohydrolase family protein n=1 Tax=Arcobacter sp. CECT 9188 TaxID=2044505 RepID=UPI000DEA4863|nr:amidohydrolase family protein [Arcobacter sp. CECT 9188]RBQ26088.1 amidohydrolase [Arcobacter sp. CECT 9188]
MSYIGEIIDFRSRPALLGEFYGSTPNTKGYETAKWLNRRVGSKDDEHFTKSFTLDGYIKEIRDSGISKAVVIGRDTPDLSISNDVIKDITVPYKELIGIASVDPQTKGISQTFEEIYRATNILGLKGINVEPTFGKPAVYFDDKDFLPVYDLCQSLNIPLFIMSGPTTPNLEHTNPAAIGRVAREFPNLKIVVCHGCYPYVNEMIGIAFRYENVFVVPDMYLFQAGSKLFVEAANGFFKDQLLFGTSYPFRPMKQTIEDFLELGFKDEILDNLFNKNAKRVLGI